MLVRWPMPSAMPMFTSVWCDLVRYMLVTVERATASKPSDKVEQLKKINDSGISIEAMDTLVRHHYIGP